MQIIKVGLHYKTTPVEIREKLAIQEQDSKYALKKLQAETSIQETVIISTCNRLEIYAVVDHLSTGRYAIKQFLSAWFAVDQDVFVSYLDIVDGDQAVGHLFRVTSGLDSMVLGETQILGQVKTAFQYALDANTTGTILNELFKQAITFAKRAHKETTIGEQAVSVSYTAVELAKHIFGQLADKHVVVFGAGEMGELTAKNLHGSGVGQMTVVNRTLEKAEQLARLFAAKAKSFQQLDETLEQADILISSTGSNSVVLSKDVMARIQKRRKGKPLFLVDIAMPRDIAPEIGELDNVFLYDIDDLQHIVDENIATREEAAKTINAWLSEEIVSFNLWMQTLGVVPMITALREKALSIQAETMNSIERKMPDLTAREKKVLHKHTKSIVNQILKEPVTQLKELAVADNAEESLTLFKTIFGIEEDVKATQEVPEHANTLKEVDSKSFYAGHKALFTR